MRCTILSLLLLIVLNLPVFAQSPDLRERIHSIVSGKSATAGVAIRLAETGDTVSYNGRVHCPMQSVYKFHLALAVYHQVSLGILKPEQLIPITKRDLLPDTWSPIREKYPEGNIGLPLREVIRYTVSESDNNGCDILFRLIGGTGKAEEFFLKNGFSDISIKATEEDMHKSWDVQYTNWTTPQEAVNVLDNFLSKKIIDGGSYQQLSGFMLETTTGPNRIRGLLPVNTRVMHKTGSSGSAKDGLYAATNDIGIIVLPDGRHLEIAVFIMNSREESESNDRMIAEIAEVAYEYFTR